MKKSNSLRARIDALEGRLVPTVSLSAGDIRIVGGDGPDTVRVTYEAVNGVSHVKVVENGFATFFRAADVTGRVLFAGYGGNDYFLNDTVVPTYANGMDGDDTVAGGSGDDYLTGGNGNDYLYGGYGNDYLEDQGTDFGVNVLYGYFGNDTIYGGNGRDYIYGEYGNDSLGGLDGDDYMSGGYGTDYMFGYGGNDYMDAGADSSWNYLVGGDGNDTMYGGNGIDYLHGEAGVDYLYGGYGDDDLDGGYDGQMDVLYGGGGHDYFRQDFSYGTWWNVDSPRDFQTGYDSLYI